jgi:glycosyltransferase involved in cell wall biosynthesis
MTPARSPVRFCASTAARRHDEWKDDSGLTSSVEFSVVIPTYNRIAMLLEVLQSLDAQSNAPLFEVVVVNDGSSDDTVARVEQIRASLGYPFHFESQKNSGPGRARNRGVEIASGRYVLFIGDDTVPEPSFLAEHARVHRENGDDPLVAVLGYTGWPGGTRVTAFMDYINDYGLQFGYKLIEHGAVVPFNFFYTSNISIAREVMAAHPFDTSFPAAAWEDIELAYRLDGLGLKIHYNAKAVTRHHHPMTVDSFARRQYTVGKSGAIFFEKHPELGHFLGVHEAREKPLASDRRMRRLRALSRLGETVRLLARPAAFEELMRQHYLRGLRDGLRAAEGR